MPGSADRRSPCTGSSTASRTDCCATCTCARATRTSWRDATRTPSAGAHSRRHALHPPNDPGMSTPTAAPPALDLAAYLRRVEYEGALEPSVEVLRALHLAHATH